MNADQQEILPEPIEIYRKRVKSILPNGLALRVGNFRKLLIERVGEGEYAGKVRVKVDQITIEADGSVRVSKQEYEPTPEEAEAIRAVASALPKPIPAIKYALQTLVDMLKQQHGERPTLFPFYDV